jgi:CO/xanthine dehydrogenase Mo-binding subunit
LSSGRSKPCEWDDAGNGAVSDATIAAHLRDGFDAAVNNGDRRNGDAIKAIASAAKKIEAVYSTPFLAHATMEPMNTTARISADRAEASVPSQNAEASLAALSEASGLAAKLTPPDPDTIKLKDPHDWKIAGEPMKRLDTADKLNGSKIYAIDVRLPNMLCAAIKDCPVFGGKVKSYDEAKIAGRPGVKGVVKVGDTAVAVVADTWYRAKSAAAATAP